MSDSRINTLGPDVSRSRPLLGRVEDVSWSSYAVTADGAGVGAYSEEAFRYLLAIERKRAECSGRPFFLLLVDLKRAFVASASMDADVAMMVFKGLSAALRDTDFTGWYREGRVAGAVLAQLSDATGDRVSHAVSQRVREQLLSRVPPTIASRLQTRFFQVPRSCRS